MDDYQVSKRTFKVGEQIRFIHCMKTLELKDCVVVTGHVDQDRVLVRFEYHDSIYGEGAIPLSWVLPKRIARNSGL